MTSPQDGNGPSFRGVNRIRAWMQHPPDPEVEEEPLEPIDQAHLDLICKGHKHGAALRAVGRVSSLADMRSA